MKQQHEIKECLDEVVDETVDEAQQDLENLTQYVESLMSRRIIIDKFVVFYKVDDEHRQVVLYGVFHNRRDYEALL